MKILHVTKKYPNALGGDATVVANLYRQQELAGHQVSIVTSNCDDIKNGSNIYKFGLRGVSAALDAITIRRLLSLVGLCWKAFIIIRKERPDIIHTHSVDMALMMSLAAHHYKVPIVHTFHIVTFHNRQQSWLRRRTELLMLKLAKPVVVTAPNLFDVQALQAVDVNEAVFLPNGIDLSYWNRRSIKHDVFTFVSVGRLEHQKGYAYLVNAVASLKRKTKIPFRVVIVGEGSQYAELLLLAKKKRILGYIEFVGKKTPEETRRLYAASDAYVSSSLWEAAALTIYEAWAMKLPVISTPVGIFQGKLAHTKPVLLTKLQDHLSLANAMLKVLVDKAYCRRLARSGHALVQENDWVNVASKVNVVYEQACITKDKDARVQTYRARQWHINERRLFLSAIIASVLLFSLSRYIPTLVHLFITLPLAVMVPGLLIYRLFFHAVSRKNVSAIVGVSIGLGLLVVMLESLAINWLLPIIGVDEPLSWQYLMPTQLLLITGLFAWYSKRCLSQKKAMSISIPFDWRRQAYIGIPLLLPILVTAGAIRQNNGAGNMLTMLGFWLMALLIIWFVVRDRHWRAPWLLYNMALSLLLSTSLRSSFVSGFDISQELQILNTTIQQHYWDIHTLPGNAYNACLSLTTLPAALQQLTGISVEVLLKGFYQLLFAFNAVVGYLIARHFLRRRLAFLATVLYIAHTQFITVMPTITRQEISLLFFSLMVYCMVGRIRFDKPRLMLISVFGLGMVLTHYSTTYLSIMILFVAAALLFAVQNIGSYMTRFTVPQFTTRLSARGLAALACLLFVFSSLWYTVINTNSTDALNTIRAAMHVRMPHSLLPDTSTNKAVLLLGGDPDKANVKNVNAYAHAQTRTLAINPATVPVLKNNNGVLVWLADTGRLVLSAMVKIVLPISPILILWQSKTRKKSADIGFLGLGAVAVFVTVIILPALAVSYNLQRVYQQVLVVLGVTFILALSAMLPFRPRIKMAVITAFAVIFFVLSPGSAFVNQIVGGIGPRMNFNNYGEEYDQFYVHTGEKFGAEWFARNCSGQTPWADRYATLRLTAYGLVPYDNIQNDILLAKHGCLYLDHANLHNNLYYAEYKNANVRYNISVGAFEYNDLIYSNNSSHVYRYR